MSEIERKLAEWLLLLRGQRQEKKHRSEPEKPEYEEEHLVFRRCLFAAIKEMRHVTALVFAYLYLAVGLTAVVVIPHIKDTVYAEGSRLPLLGGGIVFYILIPLVIGLKWYLALRDLRDEKYEVTPDGILRTVYQTLGRFQSPREGAVARIYSGYFVRDGYLQNIFNFGDVKLQVGWSNTPFILKDVYKPARVLGLIMQRAKRQQVRKSQESALGKVNLIL